MGLIDRALFHLCKDRVQAMMREELHVAGHIRVREIPFETESEWQYWWLPEVVNGKIVRPARMSEREKLRYEVYDSRNILTAYGRSQILAYIGSQNGNSTAFAQYFSVGAFPINVVQSGDASVQGELFRAVPSTANINGIQIDISTFIGTTQAVGQLTNAGLYGNGATSTLGTGSLMTHSLFYYLKTNTIPVTCDYLLTQQ